MNKPTAYQGEYQGEPAIWLTSGRYEAAVLPNIGANMIAFRDKEQGYAFLHEPTPEEFESFKERPILHGIPILYPPNRYEDGKMVWEGQEYTLPINEEDTNNHIHGFIHYIPWQVESFAADERTSHVTLALRVDEKHEVYRYLPHSFTLRLRYTLSEHGLHQQVTVRNEGATRMPWLLAFHTAINAPFAPGSQATDYRMKVTIGDRYEMSKRMLPTGSMQPLSEEEQAMKQDGVYPFYAPMDNHYTAATQDGRNRMELTDTRTGATLVYDAGSAYKHWMIYNNGGKEGFFCPEPQINLVNAPNVKGMPAEQIGLIGLEPGEIWEETSRLYVK
ncbi:aldose 1-epimerase [Xylanibacillus composti]|uniref:aldose 1-epimerase n=1 Tax=Xylanibacillus composti TaxID=1572762 RepID=UPI001FD16425|nr:aldose 1-epimerase [Xylanibacillus composti]